MALGRGRGMGPAGHAMHRQFFLGFIKIHILHHAAREPVFGLALIAELRRHGYDLSPGTLYPVLHGLEAAGYLTRTDRVVSGKVRKYYAITGPGRRALREARAKVRELVGEVLEGRGPRRLPGPRWEPRPRVTAVCGLPAARGSDHERR